MNRRQKPTGTSWVFHVCPLYDLEKKNSVYIYIVLFGFFICSWVCRFIQYLHLSAEDATLINE